MGQKSGKKWTAAAASQPTIPKSDRLLGMELRARALLVLTEPDPAHKAAQAQALLTALRKTGPGPAPLDTSATLTAPGALPGRPALPAWCQPTRCHAAHPSRWRAGPRCCAKIAKITEI